MVAATVLSISLGAWSAASPAAAATAEETGLAGAYDASFDGHATASGERFDMYRLTAASADLPLGSYAQVTNGATGESVVVRINDRPAAPGALVVLSNAAANRIGIAVHERAMVRVRDLGAHPPQLAQAEAEVDPVLCVAPPAPAAAPADDHSDPLVYDLRRAVFHGGPAPHALHVAWLEAPIVPIAGL
jgi:rare lipoprotein A